MLEIWPGEGAGDTEDRNYDPDKDERRSWHEQNGLCEEDRS